MSGEWIDISVPLYNGMAHWPGDTPFVRAGTESIAKGAEANVSEIRGSAHTGTHIDAPLHYLPDGPGIDAMPIAATVGRARVISIQDEELIRVKEVESYGLAKSERVLFKTRNSERCWKTDHFQKKFVYIPKDTARYLAERRIQTVGIDYLSVGGFESDGAETHRILLAAGIWIVEGLNLAHVEAGEYELLCLPLKIAGSDGAPARAVLRKLVL
jgi:arylformamidase